MPMTTRDAQALTYLVRRIREETYGANDWDENGIAAVLAKLVGRNLPITVEQVYRHAADAAAKTPGAISRPFLPDAPKPTGHRQSPKRSEECRLHPGEWPPPNCRPCATEGREQEYAGARDEDESADARAALEQLHGKAAWDAARLAIHHPASARPLPTDEPAVAPAEEVRSA